MTRFFSVVIPLSLGLLGCASSPDPSAATNTAKAAPPSGAPTASPAVAVTHAVAAQVAPAAGPSFPCGDHSCRRFGSAAEALAWLLNEQKPLVLAIGEAHALADGPAVRPSAARFADDLLPVLAPHTSSLVLELWAPDPACNPEKVAKTREKQAVVTEKQAKTNTNDYVRIGEISRKLGVVPFLLKPACTDYDQIEKAGADAVLAMIDVITRNMKQRVDKLLTETAEKQPGKMVVSYGGALHNDVAPRPERESWSFAADLSKRTEGRYVELDLVIPAAIRDTPSWRSLRWYEAYDREKLSDSVVLLQHAPKGFVLFFARD